MTISHLPGGRTLDEMSRSTFSEAVYPGLGFGLGFAITRLLPSTATKVRRDLRHWIDGAICGSGRP